MEALPQRLKSYHDETYPVIDFFGREKHKCINCDKKIPEVEEQVMQVLEPYKREGNVRNK
jgi:adenylate kinase family enzyme